MEISPDLVRAYFLLGNDYKSLRTGQCCFLFIWRDIDNEIVHLLFKTCYRNSDEIRQNVVVNYAA